MGKLLDDVEYVSLDYHALNLAARNQRERLRKAMREAHDEGISMNKIAKAAGLTREGVRYALKESRSEEAEDA